MLPLGGFAPNKIYMSLLHFAMGYYVGLGDRTFLIGICIMHPLVVGIC